MKREKTIGGILAFVVVTILALPFSVDVPILSSYILTIFLLNTVFAFVSIFLQRLVIVLYEVNVFEKTNTIVGYAFKYFAIYSSGMNYYVQTICNRLPFVLNKLVAIIIFVYMILGVFLIGSIYND